jgi:hypothetical protein
MENEKKHLFQPGNPGGPGRPKGSGLNLTSLLKAKLEDIPENEHRTYSAMFVETLLNKALVDGDLQSLKLIMNYVDGLPKQSIDLTTQGDKITYTNDQIKRAAGEILDDGTESEG